MGFWLFFLIVPILTGSLAYHWEPREIYTPIRDTVITSHEVCGGANDQNCGEMVDVWKVNATGEVISRADFAEKRLHEAERLAFVWFMYGLIGCYFAAYVASESDGSRFTKTFLVGLGVDAVVAVFTFFGIRD